MVRNQTDRNIFLLVRFINNTRKLTYLIADCLHRINIKHRIHVLYHHSKTLQAHTGINILLRKLRVIALAVAVKLRKYVVPNLHKTVALAAYLTVRLSAAILDTPVVINLRTRSARSRAVLPKVIALARFRVPVKARNLLCRHADFFCPNVKRLFILTVNRRIKTLRVKPYHLRQKFPAPRKRLMLKIIPEREIAKHLKKRQMSCRLADILNITRADTLLTRCHSPSRRHLLPCKIRL